MEQVLAGGVANAGAVVRVGEHVLRPSNPHSPSIHRYLHALRAAGFEGASDPVGVDADGRERLVFIAGEVAVPPFPAWVQTDAALASLARLMRQLHDAARSFAADPADTWSDEMADPEGAPAGSVVGHNDVCLENVVFRDGEAVGLLDFDFASPGRPVWDLAAMARMCVPIDDDVNATRLGWEPADKPARLRLVADAYGLDADGRTGLVEVLGEVMHAGGAFVRRRVEAGEQPFIEMWERMGGQERFDRRRRWWDAERASFEAALA
jgi:aminoglycoside phosphotransferase (APT) family kinase protein